MTAVVFMFSFEIGAWPANIDSLTQIARLTVVLVRRNLREFDSKIPVRRIMLRVKNENDKGARQSRALVSLLSKTQIQNVSVFPNLRTIE